METETGVTRVGRAGRGTARRKGKERGGSRFAGKLHARPRDCRTKVTRRIDNFMIAFARPDPVFFFK